MKKIILDTNFLLIPYHFRVDIFSEIKRICSFTHEICIIDKTIDELKKIITKQKGKDRLAAMLALVLLKQKDVHTIKTKENLTVDEIIIEKAGKGTIVATQDSELKSKLKKNHISLIVLRNKSHLSLLEN